MPRPSIPNPNLLDYCADMRISGELAETTLKEYARILRTVPYELPGTPRQAKDWIASLGASKFRRAWLVRALKHYARWHAAEMDTEGSEGSQAPQDTFVPAGPDRP